jgi:MEKHLA domain
MLQPWQQPEVIRQAECLIRSYQHWTGREFLSGSYALNEGARQLFEATFVVVSHGVEADPILNYGNQAALNLWQLS